MRLLLLGPPAVAADGAPQALPFERRAQLAAFLALRRAWVPRTELAALLWPELPDKLAYTNLRKTLFRLQSSPWSPRIDAEGSALRLDAATDVADFESALRDGRTADALALRRGDLLAGWDDGSPGWTAWLAYERDRLRAAWRGAALAHLATGLDAAEGIELSSRLLDADPLDEAALAAHLGWLAKGGQAARARTAYRDFARRLDEELGVAPGAELRALHDALAATRMPAAVSAPPAPADDGFVGRAAELKRIAALLAQDDARIVTITGPGGVGKTRLARRVLDLRGDGDAVFVTLEDLATTSELGPRLARELGVRLAGGDALEQVIAFLRDRPKVLVLDNFEQLAGEAAVLTRLTAAHPRLKLVVTSRVRLAQAGEWLVPLSGLPWPDAEDVDRFEAFDAVRLFVRAAQRVEPALVPASEAAAILDICRQVEGLPLALELAASWTRVLSCDAIAAELREGTELLRATDASRPARQASIEVVFDQSWKRLGAAERDALARLSVFRGGFTPEAARAVTGAALPVLGSLADKSLLRKDGARLQLHPLVQQLAGRKLDGTDARLATERVHAARFLRLLAQRGDAVADGHRDALAEVEAEFENIRAAWRFAANHGDAGPLMRATVPLESFCDVRGRLDEGLAMLRDAIASPAARDVPLALLLAACASHFEYRLDRYAEAHALAERTFAATDPERDTEARQQCRKTLAACALRLGRLEDARRHYQAALDARPADVDPNNAAAMLDNLALVERQMGHYDEAIALSTRSLAQHRALGDAAGTALCLNNLASMHMDLKAFDTAGTYLRESAAIAEKHGLAPTLALAMLNLAQIAVETMDVDAAAPVVDRARETVLATKNRVMACWIELVRVRLEARRGDGHAARSALKTAIALARSVGRSILERSAVSMFVEVLDAEGESLAARRVLAFLIGHPTTTPAERQELGLRLTTLPPGDDAWPGLTLDELIRRLSDETDAGHAPLTSVLRGRA